MNNIQEYKAIPKHGVIDAPGNYYLANDFISKDMFAIKIECNNVNLDLNERGIYTDLSDRSKTAFGIYALECANIHVSNGKISGSSIAFHAPYNDNLTIHNLNIHSCTHMGINVGGKFEIKNCYISNIGGHKEEAYAVGINAPDAFGSIIELNRIEEIYRQNVSHEIDGEGVGILLGHQSFFCFISQNTIINNEYQRNTYSIWAVGKDHKIYENVLCNNQFGVYMGKSLLENNIIFLKKPQEKSYAITGGMGACINNTFINYKELYCYDLQEEITENIPFITD